MIRRRAFWAVLLLFASFLFIGHALAGAATVSWTANAEPDLAGYRIYYGTSTRTGVDPNLCGLCGYSTMVDVGRVISYPFSNLTGGQTYYFSITAYDALNNESSFSAEVNKAIAASDTTPPTVAMTAPASGATVSGTVTLSATASDPVVGGQTTSGVASVQFRIDGTNFGSPVTVPPYQTSWNTATATNSSHTLTAIASDVAGNQTTATTVTVTVSNTTADTQQPVTSLTSPTASSTVQGTVTVSATASDNVGVASVRFILDGIALGSPVTTPPYQVFWNTITATNATHTLRAVATDAAGNASSSPTVNVTVANAPTVTLTAPTNGATLSGTAQFVAVATSPGGNPTAQFIVDGLDFGSPISAPPYQVFWDTTQATNGTHTVRVKATDIGGNQSTSPAATVTVSNNPSTTLTASLAANPSSGTTPLTVSLTGTAGGTASGTMNFTFYCNNSSAGTSITTPYDYKINNVITNPLLASNICIYSAAGTYTPKVIIEQGTSVTEARGTIVVSTPSVTPPPPSPSTGGGGPAGGGGSFIPSLIVGMSIGSTTPVSARVIITTSLPATVRLSYGTSTTGYGATVNSSLLLTTTFFNLTDLIPNASYRLRAAASAIGQTASSPELTFVPSAFTSAASSPTPSPATSPITPSLPTTISSIPHFLRTLTLGSQGSDVTDLQTILKAQNYLLVSATGYFGNLTKRAVQSFQAANSITPVSGVVGPLTRTKLNQLISGAPSSTAAPATTTTAPSGNALSLGASGAAVTALQSFLRAQGYLSSAPTGYFGPLTERAVQGFQCDQNIVCSGTPATTGFGSVGPKTRARIGQ